MVPPQPLTPTAAYVRQCVKASRPMWPRGLNTLAHIGGGRGQWLGGHHGECGARVYNGGLGAEPAAGSRSRAPGHGVRGAKPPEAESILVIGCPTEPANLAPLVKFSK